MAIGSQQFLGELLQALVEFAPEQFLNGALRTRCARSCDAAEGAQLVQAHDFDFGIALSEFLPKDGILRRRPAIVLGDPREFDQAVDIALENQDETRAVSSALVHEGANSYVPAIVHLAENVLRWNMHIAEENLVEFALAGHLSQRANRDAG